MSIHGRARRRDYWIAQFALNLLALISGVLTWLAVDGYDPNRSTKTIPLLLIVPTVVLGWALLALCVRRLHDIGLSGLWVLMPIPAALIAQFGRGANGPGAIPALAGTALVLLALLDGTAGPNRFGDDPKGRDADQDAAPARLRGLVRGADRWTGTGIGAVALLWTARSWALGLLSAVIPTALATRIGDASVRDAIPIIWRCSAPGAEQVLTQLAGRLAPDAKVKIVYTTAPGLFGMAFPGGRIIVGEGAVRVAERPEELAGLLAHELAHSILRHPERKFVSAAILAMLPRTLIAPHGLADRGWAQPYSRAIERDADAEAARMMARAGIAPRHLGSMLMRIDAVDAARIRSRRSWQATHPATSDRMAYLSKLAAPTVERDAIPLQQQAIVRGGCQLSASSFPMIRRDRRSVFDRSGMPD